MVDALPDGLSTVGKILGTYLQSRSVNITEDRALAEVRSLSKRLLMPTLIDIRDDEEGRAIALFFEGKELVACTACTVPDLLEDLGFDSVDREES